MAPLLFRVVVAPRDELYHRPNTPEIEADTQEPSEKITQDTSTLENPAVLDPFLQSS
jgi:hypothetical protein